MVTLLVREREMKLMTGSIKKPNQMDVRGLNRLQGNEPLPTVGIPVAELRDARVLPKPPLCGIHDRPRPAPLVMDKV